MMTLKEARQQKGWTVTQLAQEASVSPSTVSAIESGSRKPTASTAMKISAALGVGMSEIEEFASASLGSGGDDAMRLGPRVGP
jgi:transcriptional regulator with XRE-family HTH domain